MSLTEYDLLFFSPDPEDPRSEHYIITKDFPHEKWKIYTKVDSEAVGMELVNALRGRENAGS